MKVAQIGVGGWGRNHARVLSEMGILGAICDGNPERREEFSSKYTVPSYDTVDELLKREDFDAAFVCTPTSTHVDVASHIIKAKKHVFVEKPMTYSVSDGMRLAELAKKNRVLLTCGYIERFNPAVSAVKQIMLDKEYGEPLVFNFRRKNRMPLHIMDVGIIYDTAVHDIDTALWLFDEEPEVVYARAGSIHHKYEDFVSIMLGFSKDRVAVISSNWLTPLRVREFEGVCSDAVISLDFITQKVKISGEKTIVLPIVKKEPLSLELQSFIGAIQDKNKLVVTPQQAVNVTKIAKAALLSSQKGTAIYL
ncbi:MAG: oxidoreductase domain-containing protein [Cenarchaeum symbiont of Oopsacas minuta]|nr:oxidoreductase domain-containing protein [Cenarchaeum symbiont of Oopsacas minuta]